MKNLLISVYGVNNLGKTTQVKLLKKHLEQESFKVFLLKFPLCDLPPTGPRINDYLCNGNPERLSALKFQTLCAQNRKDFDKTLRNIILENDVVIVEDYIGTGIAWGMGAGIPKKELIKLNEGLVKEDLSILLDGKRFMQSVEKNHKHEQDHNLIERVRRDHLELAFYYGWQIVYGWMIMNANNSPEAIHEKIWPIVKLELSSRKKYSVK
jgi:thymidylate kinase